MKKVCYLFSLIVLANASVVSAQQVPGSGELVITEVMANPQAVSDNKGEWVELLNVSDHKILLNGLIIKDLGSNRHVIQPDDTLSMDPGEYLVLAKNGDPAENGGVTAGYVYQGFSLSNSEDEIILELEDGTLIDQVIYQDQWPLVAGASFELHADHLNATENDDPQFWSQAVTPYGAGDLGTPGSPSATSLSITISEKPATSQCYPNPCSDNFFLKIQLPGAQESTILIRNLLGQPVMIDRTEGKAEFFQQYNVSGWKSGLYFIAIYTPNGTLWHRLIIR